MWDTGEVTKSVEPTFAQYEAAGFVKWGSGNWVLNDSRARRMGIVISQGSRWRFECDRLCESDFKGSRVETRQALIDHWRTEHGYVDRGV